MGRGVVVLGVCLVALSGCRAGDPGPEETPSPSATGTAATEATDEASPGAGDSPLEVALDVVPAGAEQLTVTDWDAIRTRLGVPDLTGEDPMTDRLEFAERAGEEAVLLTDGLLAEHASELALDHGFTGDDVDWEARWRGPGGGGWLLAMRPDLDMTGVQDAVDAGVGPLAGAELEGNLVHTGTGNPAGSWWDGAQVADVDAGAESTYLHAGCIPVQEALGVDATRDDQQALLSRHDPASLQPLDGLVLGFTDDVATVWLGADRTDLGERARLVADWPVSGDLAVTAGFSPGATAQAGEGRLDLDVVDPRAAARLTLTHVLPFGICNEVVPFEEPTGR